MRAFSVHESASEIVARGAASRVAQARLHAAMATAAGSRPFVDNGCAVLAVVTVGAEQVMIVVEPHAPGRRRDTISADDADILRALSAGLDPPDRAAGRRDDG